MLRHFLQGGIAAIWGTGEAPELIFKAFSGKVGMINSGRAKDGGIAGMAIKLNLEDKF